MEDVMHTVLENSGILDIIKNVNKASGHQTEQKADTSLDTCSSVFMWQGGFHLLPEEYKLPILSCRNAFSLWCYGNPLQKVPPLRFVKPTDFSNSKERKKFSEFKFVMHTIEKNLKIDPSCIENYSLEKVQEIFTKTKEALGIEDHTVKNRKRRLEQLSWTSAAVFLRNKK